MALQLADRVQQTGTANTTVSFNLSGSVSGYQSFSSAITTGNTTYYAASDGTNWEVGVGTLTSSSLLTRTTVVSSSNSGSAVSTFGSSINIFVTQPAENTVVSSNNPGTSGYVLTSNGTGVAPSWAAGGQVYPGSGIANSTGTAWGTSYTTTGSGTVVALATSPVFVTPTLGVASATSLSASSTVTGSAVIASNGLILNSATVAASYTIATGNNAMSVGPMTVASGQSVTVSSGQRWVIL